MADTSSWQVKRHDLPSNYMGTVSLDLPTSPDGTQVELKIKYGNKESVCLQSIYSTHSGAIVNEDPQIATLASFQVADQIRKLKASTPESTSHLARVDCLATQRLLWEFLADSNLKIFSNYYASEQSNTVFTFEPKLLNAWSSNLTYKGVKRYSMNIGVLDRDMSAEDASWIAYSGHPISLGSPDVVAHEFGHSCQGFYQLHLVNNSAKVDVATIETFAEIFMLSWNAWMKAKADSDPNNKLYNSFFWDDKLDGPITRDSTQFRVFFDEPTFGANLTHDTHGESYFYLKDYANLIYRIKNYILNSGAQLNLKTYFKSQLPDAAILPCAFVEAFYDAVYDDYSEDQVKQEQQAINACQKYYGVNPQDALRNSVTKEHFMPFLVLNSFRLHISELGVDDTSQQTILDLINKAAEECGLSYLDNARMMKYQQDLILKRDIIEEKTHTLDIDQIIEELTTNNGGTLPASITMLIDLSSLEFYPQPRTLVSPLTVDTLTNAFIEFNAKLNQPRTKFTVEKSGTKTLVKVESNEYFHSVTYFKGDAVKELEFIDPTIDTAVQPSLDASLSKVVPKRNPELPSSFAPDTGDPIEFQPPAEDWVFESSTGVDLDDAKFKVLRGTAVFLNDGAGNFCVLELKPPFLLSELGDDVQAQLKVERFFEIKNKRSAVPGDQLSFKVSMGTRVILADGTELDLNSDLLLKRI